MLLSLIKRLPVDQRKALSAKLRAVEQDTSIGPARKAEIARDFIAKAAKSLEAEAAQVKELMYPEEEMPKNNKMVTMAVVEAKATTMDEPTKKPGRSHERPEPRLWRAAPRLRVRGPAPRLRHCTCPAPVSGAPRLTPS